MAGSTRPEKVPPVVAAGEGPANTERAETSAAAPADRVRVFIADDSLLIREGLASLLQRSELVRVAGVHADAEALLAAVEADPPDVVLTDIRMPPTHTDEGMRVAQRLRETHPRVGVVVLSQHGSAQYAAQLLAGGASGRGYLLKDRIHQAAHLVDTLVAVAHGECRVDPQLVEALVAGKRRRSPLNDLTPRQREVLSDIAEGCSNAAIARRHGLSAGAVEKHIGEIFGRLGLANDESVNRRVHATLLYLADRNA